MSGVSDPQMKGNHNEMKFNYKVLSGVSDPQKKVEK
jgi:hypothetical protein